MGRQQRRAMLVLLGLILIRGFAGGGINMTASLYLAPVSETLGVGIGALSLYFSIMSVVTVIWLPFAGKLINRCPVRVLALTAAVFQAFSFAGFGLQNHVLGWYLLAVPQAMGATILVSLLGPILINRWFPHNTGLVLGLQMAFVGLFAAVLQPLASRLIEGEGWRNAYFATGLVTFAVVAAAAFLLRDQPGQEPAGGPSETRSKQASAGGVEIPEKTAVRSASFLLLLIFIIAMTGVAAFTQHVPTYGGRLGYSLSRVGLAMSLASVGSAIGSVAIGYISDRIGGLKTCYGILLLWILAVVGFLCSGAGFAVFAASAFLHGIASASVGVIVPILTLIFYGKLDYEKIYAKVSMGAPLASILLVPAYGFIYDASGSYTAVLVLLAGLLLVAGAAIILGWRNRCTAAGCPVWRRAK